MPWIPGEQINTGDFVHTTSLYDIDMSALDVNSQDFKQLIVKLQQTVNNIALVLNRKESGQHILEEFVTGAQFFNPTDPNPLLLRPEYRKVFNTGAIGAGATVIAHGLTIDANWHLIYLGGGADDNAGFNYYPIPFSSAGGAANIEIVMNAVNITITNNSGIAFTSGIVVVLFLKQ